jgi:hypothetical protein
LEGYSLSKLLKAFSIDDEVDQDAFEDTYNLRKLVSNARPKGESFKWYNEFLMSSYKPTSYFL